MKKDSGTAPASYPAPAAAAGAAANGKPSRHCTDAGGKRKEGGAP